MKFKKIVAGALGYVFHFRRVLAKALLIPFVLYMALDATEYLELSVAASFVVGIFGILVQTIFAITTHRVILLGANSVPEWGMFRWTKRETLFALHFVGLVIIAVPLGMPFFLIPELGSVIAVLLISWIAGRLSLVFPAIAIDQGVSFKLSWRLTKHHQVLMFFVVAIFPILLVIPAILVNMLPHAFLLASFITTFATVFMVAALSVTYKVIYDETY